MVGQDKENKLVLFRNILIIVSQIPLNRKDLIKQQNENNLLATNYEWREGDKIEIQFQMQIKYE
ncbi:MAG: hypothetical protein DRH21_02845 [Deltaproteobacteria bacterium]|nr:MAG: hypothetical protein DRH21_02845 [Deltaproteobacteria bacterium]